MKQKISIGLFRNCCLAVMAAALASCSSVPAEQMTKMMKEQKFLPFIPPQGNPATYAGWNNYGPGVLMNPSNYNAIRSADDNLGAARVKQIAKDANDPKARDTFGAFSNKKVSGNSFDGSGGWTFNAVAKISAALKLEHSTTVDVKFGDTYVAAPFSYNQLQQTLRAEHVDFNKAQRQRLTSGKSQLIFKTIYTNSVTYYFNNVTKAGGEGKVTVGPEALSKLQSPSVGIKGSVNVTSDGGVTLNAPMIIGYVPVPSTDMDDVLP